MNTHFRLDLQIAELPVRICSDLEIRPGASFAPFLAGFDAPAVTAVIKGTDVLPPHPQEVLLEENCYRVYPDGRGGFIRGFYDIHSPLEDYARETVSEDGRDIAVRYLPSGASILKDLDNVFFHIGIEGLMIRDRKLCLHASLVRTALGGILFSGPSGIGKSTQADLWCRLEHAELLNGDRPIVGQKDGTWYGWGSPYAGSSRCYVNEGCPVSAVVMLEQASSSAAERLPLAQAFRKIYSGLTVNSWDSFFSVTAFDLAVKLAEEVPVYRLSCTPDETAVKVLKDRLQKDLPYHEL